MLFEDYISLRYDTSLIMIDDKKRFRALIEVLKERSPLALAFSGGLDSSVLAYMAQRVGCDIVLVHIVAPHFSARERRRALAWAALHNFPFITLELDAFHMPAVANNHKDRCYHCKKYMLSCVQERVRQEFGVRIVCDGSHADDAEGYRPGQRAVQELGVFSPFAACALGKADIRSLAHAQGLAHLERNVQPCLLTRCAYGVAPRTHVARLDAAEAALEDVGLTSFRLRLCPEPVLQTAPFSVSHERVRAILAEHGYEDARILVEECISGFFDRI